MATARTPPSTHGWKRLLEADAAFLGLLGGGRAVAEVLGYIGVGPLADDFAEQPSTIGFFEAHALAAVIGVLLLRSAGSPERASGHALAAVVHGLLAGANVAFWKSFRANNMVATGLVTTALHIAFTAAQTTAWRRTERS